MEFNGILWLFLGHVLGLLLVLHKPCFAQNTFGFDAWQNNRYLDLHMYIQVVIDYIPIYVVEFQVRQLSLQL